jgi:hypothetical protein
MAKNENLLAAIATALEKLEQSGDIVVAAQSSQIAVHLYDAMKDCLPIVQLTAGECGAAGSLILHAVEDERFFDWEMPTLTGGSADEFRAIGRKLMGRLPDTID